MNTRQRRVLAVAYGGGHIAMLLPVLRALRQRDAGLHVDLLALTTAARAARAAGETPLGYADLLHLLNEAERARALELGAAAMDGNAHPDVGADETRAYLGVNRLDLEWQYGADGAQARYAQHGRHGFHPAGFMRRVVDALRPDLVLTTNSPRSEEAVVDAARAAGVPSVALLDLFGLPGDAFAARSRHPDRVCVLAPQVRDNLVAAGWPREIIAVTGNPAFDTLLDPAWAQRAAEWRATLGWQHKKVVLLATQPEMRAHPDVPWPAGDALALAMEHALRLWVGGRDDVALIVRHHPNHGHRLPAQAPAPNVHVSRGADEPIEMLIRAADAVVVQATTVGLQAAVAGVPVLALRCSPAVRHGIDYAALGAARSVADLDALPAALAAVLGAPPAPGPWARHAAAADAVAQQVLALLESRTGTS